MSWSMVSHPDISIHAPLRGRRRAFPLGFPKTQFQSTPPCGGDARAGGTMWTLTISIHAPLRGRPDPAAIQKKLDVFQSTPPCGGDRFSAIRYYLLATFQSTPPCGGDYTFTQMNPESLIISIHAPLRGRQRSTEGVGVWMVFQSTPPCGGDSGPAESRQDHQISIHAPLRGRQRFQLLPVGGNDFNPRPLAGATMKLIALASAMQFQSTPPCGGDSFTYTAGQKYGISIHAPLRGRRGLFPTVQ